jgi:hypothetical protein
VTTGTPDRTWYSVSSKGLLEAAKFVKDFSSEIGGTLKNLGNSFWQDFKLTDIFDNWVSRIRCPPAEVTQNGL